MVYGEEKIVVEDPRYFDRPVVMVVRSDHYVDVFQVDEGGLEEYSGKLDHPNNADVDQIGRLVRAIRERIVERPLSRSSLRWLQALAHVGMLARWEDKHVR